ncbi:MAG: heme/copper-type cytochrome/quinol oxidase subunit 3 [Lentimonas sp.]|jgi:heme/copper-type cytochrome/quinol oxidase subunit 3
MSSSTEQLDSGATFDPHATRTGISNKKLTMWLFLASDCMFFGTLISTHLIYRRLAPDVVDPSQIFDLGLTSFATVILLLSSYMMALTSSAAKEGRMLKFRISLLGVVLLGAVFLGSLGYEYHHLLHEYELGLGTNIFSSTFYLLTGTHGVHVCLGLVWLLSWFFYSFKKGLNLKEAAEDVESVSLYWHFVELVWVVIFTLVYLIEFI